MFASIRRYRLRSGAMEELNRRVDTGFAEEISAQSGFVSYEFIDCGDGEIVTVSIFRDAGGADASRDLAQRWTEANLQDLEFTRLDAMHGEIMVSRAARDMLEPGHVGAGRGFASLRRYRADTDSVEEMMHIADTDFADQIAEVDGFEAYHAIECGGGDIVAITVMRDRTAMEESEELAAEFVREKLGGFDIERTETLTGEVVISRARADLLEPAHA